MILNKHTKKFLRDVYNKRPKEKTLSLMECPRIGGYSEDGENFSIYGFLPDRFSQYTDSEVREYLDENMREEIYSPYDCTGKRFTEWISFHRNPNGRISYVHRMGIDV